MQCKLVRIPNFGSVLLILVIYKTILGGLASSTLTELLNDYVRVRTLRSSTSWSTFKLKAAGNQYFCSEARAVEFPSTFSSCRHTTSCTDATLSTVSALFRSRVLITHYGGFRSALTFLPTAFVLGPKACIWPCGLCAHCTRALLCNLCA